MPGGLLLTIRRICVWWVCNSFCKVYEALHLNKISCLPSLRKKPQTPKESIFGLNFRKPLFTLTLRLSCTTKRMGWHYSFIVKIQAAESANTCWAYSQCLCLFYFVFFNALEKGLLWRRFLAEFPYRFHLQGALCMLSIHLRSKSDCVFLLIMIMMYFLFRIHNVDISETTHLSMQSI